MKQNVFWGILLPFFFCISCNDDKPLAISLDQTEITFESSGGEVKIQLSSNGNWSADNIPDWISIDHTSGNTSTEITVTAQSNENSEARSTDIIFVHDNQSVILNVFQAASSPTISLGQTEIKFESSGGEVKIQLTSNGNWSADNIPDWISIDHTSGNTSTEVTVTAQPNENSEVRSAEIVFTHDDQIANAMLSVFQAAPLTWSSLSFSSFEKVNYDIGENNIERIYNFSTRQMFVNPTLNPDMNEELFLGNLVNRKFNSNSDILVYKGYTFNPIIVFPSTIGLEKSRTFIPSKSEQDAFANEIIAKKPTQSEHFRSGMIRYNSHRELHLIGVGNMGISLDEIISGKSYQEQEMAKKTGMIYSFSHTLFTLEMEMQAHIAKEEIDKNDFPDNNLCYISSVSYGRIGLLIIESDHDYIDVKVVVEKVLQGGTKFSQEEQTILDELNAYHLYFDKSQKLHTTRGKVDAIKAYNNQATKDLLNVFPFKFTLADYFNSGQGEMSFSVVLP